LGFLKNMRDMQAQGQEMAQQAQAGMGGGAGMSDQVAYGQMAQKLYHGGVDASGVVHTIRPGQPDMTGNVWTEFDVSIKKPDGELYQTTIKQSMLPAQLEEIREGAAITVKYDPDSPTSALIYGW
jgi:hypothetical protein